MPLQQSVVVRDTLRERARTLLRSKLLQGVFGPGRLNESELALQIGVSRTPLREALRGLEEEGLLYSVANQGFYVKPLAIEEVREIYPILWNLEALALRTAGPFTADHLAALDTLNAELARASGSPSDALTLDTRWHTELLRGCANRRLLDMIDGLKRAASRYEFAYMQQANRVTVSAAQHRTILSALQASDIGDAVRGLESNWRVTLEATEKWLLSRTA